MKKGFSLVELLVILAVIALLFAFAVPLFKGAPGGKKARAEGEIRLIKVAIESYYKNHSYFPEEAGYQDTLLGDTPKLLEEKLYDVFGATENSKEYAYKLSTGSPLTSKYYIIYSVGPKGNGSALINNDGAIIVSGEAIWISNSK